MATKEEWKDYFEAVNGRKPTLEDFQKAHEAGEIDDFSVAPGASAAPGTGEASDTSADPNANLEAALVAPTEKPKKSRTKMYILAAAVAVVLVGGTLIYANRATVARTFESPKLAFGTDLISLGADSTYNTADISMSLDQFNYTDTADQTSADTINKELSGLNMDIKAISDNQDQTMSMSLGTQVSGKNYQLGMIAGKDGVYINATDIKNMISSAASSSDSSVSAYGGLYSSFSQYLSSPYLWIDAKTIDQGMANSQSYEQQWANFFTTNGKQSTSTPNVVNAYNALPEKDFQKTASTTTVTLSNADLETFIENSEPTSGTYTKAQVQQIFASMEQSATVNETLTITIDSSAHSVSFVYSGNFTSKTDSSQSLVLKATITVKLGKSSQTIAEPDSSQTETLTQLENKITNYYNSLYSYNY